MAQSFLELTTSSKARTSYKLFCQRTCGAVLLCTIAAVIKIFYQCAVFNTGYAPCPIIVGCRENAREIFRPNAEREAFAKLSLCEIPSLKELGTRREAIQLKKDILNTNGMNVTHYLSVTSPAWHQCRNVLPGSGYGRKRPRYILTRKARNFSDSGSIWSGWMGKEV